MFLHLRREKKRDTNVSTSKITAKLKITDAIHVKREKNVSTLKMNAVIHINKEKDVFTLKMTAAIHIKRERDRILITVKSYKILITLFKLILCKINRESVITIQILFDLTRFVR